MLTGYKGEGLWEEEWSAWENQLVRYLYSI